MADITIQNNPPTPSPSPLTGIKKGDIVNFTNLSGQDVQVKDFNPPSPPLFDKGGYKIKDGETRSLKVIATIPKGQTQSYEYKCPPDSAMQISLTDGSGIIIVDGGPGPRPRPKRQKASATKKTRSKSKAKPQARPMSKSKKKAAAKRKAKKPSRRKRYGRRV
jgi:hypothetical protein